LRDVHRMQPVSALRVGITGRLAPSWNSLIDNGLIEAAGQGMLGCNYRVADHAAARYCQ